MSYKNEGKFIVIIIISLVAFTIGAGVGISLGMGNMDPVSNMSNNSTHMENVTEKMTTNLTNNTQDINIDNQTGSGDFNENKTFNVEKDSLVFYKK